ncbi:MAG: hypothetical protein A2287_05015 [Candidatus Melainabacteria bacterium RIFOXYA12_FULL_32_12]|nr:MAG: hypothetical protein A2287_05015 [Candidatus Melainabacteria bacterium RIFOXYA12_FULL_32_12]
MELKGISFGNKTAIYLAGQGIQEKRPQSFKANLNNSDTLTFSLKGNKEADQKLLDYLNKYSDERFSIENKSKLVLNFDTIKDCIEEGVSPDIKDKKGRTALFHAADSEQSDSKEIMEFLIKKGANVDEKDDAGDNPLYKTIIRNYTDKAELLINNGADPNATDKLLGDTALHNTKSIKIAKLLIDNNADLTIKNVYGENPYNCAMRRGNYAIAGVIKEEMEKKGLNTTEKSTPTKLSKKIKEFFSKIFGN